MLEPSEREIEVFNGALELAGPERSQFLEEACAGDAGLRQRVGDLLRSVESVGTFLESSPAGPTGAGGSLASPVRPAEQPGDRIGRYKLLQQIGEGGCGIVYMAEQLEPVQRRVALKVIKLGMDTKSVIARFEAERQALALMDHPNIARVLDAGATDAGRPYFVMELVRGSKITDYCDQNNLSTRERLDLFVQVCRAVQHAHQKGIIHRDLKPSNILVTMNDGVPMTKVIDFGIAKATQGKLANQTVFTAFEQFIGTPAYMSPEQAELSAQDVDTRSDIYSLGVLLYELLTGQTPFSARKLRQAGLDEIRRTIREDEPVRPSTRLSTMRAVDLTGVARSRSAEPPGLIHLVRGDLDWIVMKALEKDRARRYETANGLAADIQRHLKHEPVVARPPGNLYAFQKLVRRNRFFFGAAAVVAVVGILGFAGIFWQWRQAELNAQEASRQRGIAERDTVATRMNLYAADVALASQALQNGDLRLGRKILDGLRPKPGEMDLRGFEWRYLWNLCRGEELTALTGHEKTVTCSAFSPDNTRLATGSQDGTVRIWDVATHQTIRILLVSSNQVWSVGFTPDGQWLMTAGSEEVEFREVGTWEVRARFPGRFAVLAKTGTLLATDDSQPYYYQPAGAVSLWNWRTGQLLRRLAPPGRVRALAADGRLLAMVETNSTVSVWDTASGERVREWPMTHPTWSLDFSPDGRELLAAGWSRYISLWKLTDPSPPQVIKSLRLNFWSAAFSPDGTTIATGGADRRVRLWDAATLEPKSVLRGHESEIWCATFSPDGKLLATGGTDDQVLLWSAATVQRSESVLHDGDFRPLFSPDGRWLVTMNPTNKDAMLWQVADRKLVASRAAPGKFIFGFSPDGTRLITMDNGRRTLQFRRPNATLPDQEVPLAGLNPGPVELEFSGMSPARDLFLMIDGTGVIRIWNTATGQLFFSLNGPPPPYRNAVISPGGKYLALSLYRENIARLYECATGRELQLAGHVDFVSGLAFSPDNSTLATGSMDGTIRLWNTRTGAAQAVLAAHMAETSDVAFSPDGRTLASIGKGESLKLWHVPTLREVVFEDEPQAGIFVRFSPDGRTLAAQTAPDELRLLSAPPE